jgi:SH3-like domain-containing protein
MLRHSSKVFVAALLPVILAGCVKVYTTPEQDKLTIPPPPTPENTGSELGGIGGANPEELNPSRVPYSPAVTPNPNQITPPPTLPTLKATPERPIPGQLKAQQSTSRINVRERPGTNYRVLFSVHPKDTVMITDETLGDDGYQWYRIDHRGSGWVREDLLTLDREVATIKAIHRNATINVREGPGQNHRVIHDAYVGDRFPVTTQARDANGYTWHRLDLGYGGWVRSDFLNKGTATFN